LRRNLECAAHPVAEIGGANSEITELKMVNTGGIAGESLRSLVSRIERLEEDKKAIAEDIKEVYAEAKALGF